MSLLSSFLNIPVTDDRIRRSYRREVITEATLPMSFAIIEGGFAGVVADKVFAASPLVIAVIAAAPMFTNLTSFAWARLIRGKPKVKILVAIKIAILFFVGLVGLTPAPEDGGVWVLVGCVLAIRFLMVGMVTARSLVWSINYQREARARITGRLTIVNSLTMVVVGMAGGLLMDADPDAFRWVFVAAALFGLVGVNAFRKVIVVGEAEFLTAEVEPDTTSSVGMWQVLKRDKKFAEYQVYQFLAGTSNMMIEAPVIYLVSNQLGAGYTTSILLAMIIPFSLSLITLPFWARYLDANHVTLFRARQSSLWVISQLTVFAGALASSLWLLGLGRVILGVARGGGSLAWNLGHNDFAKPKELGSYMGAHVTLTGIRGAFAPFVGMLLYVGWQDLPLLPDYEGLGAGVFLIAAVLSAISWAGYRRMKLELQNTAGVQS